MDEVSLFAALAPGPPADLEEMAAQARARLVADLSDAGPGGRLGWRRLGRRRWLVPGLAALALAVCAAIVVPVLLPGGTPASVVTKAWAVQRNPDGTVTVRISQFAFDSGLAQTLRSDGVPALIRARVVHDPSYRPADFAHAPGVCYPVARSKAPLAVQEAVIRLHFAPGSPAQQHLEFVVHPAAMPAGSVLYVSTATIYGSGKYPSGAFTVWVLKQDRQPACTS